MDSERDVRSEVKGWWLDSEDDVQREGTKPEINFFRTVNLESILPTSNSLLQQCVIVIT